MWLSLLILPALAGTPGAQLKSPPIAAPGGLTHLPDAMLSSALTARARGAEKEAILELEAWLSSRNGPLGHKRTSGRFLLGWLYLQNGETNLASAQFTKVRTAPGPLAPMALYYEALCDHKRGRHSVAAQECADYRVQWPQGEHADDCLLLIGTARAKGGQHQAAKNAWVDWLAENQGHPRSEQVELDLAIARAHLGSQQALRSLQNFTLYHGYPSIAQQAQSALRDFENGGKKLPAMDPLQMETRSIMAHVRAGQYDTAWDRFTELLTTHGDDERLQNWLDKNAVDVAWKTRNYEAYVSLARTQYNANPTGHAAWRIFRALQRSGDYFGAGVWAEASLVAHKRHYRWRDSQEQIGHTWQLAGEYEKAQIVWDGLANRGGSSGRDARWFAAFSTYRAGDLPNALERMEQVEKTDKYRLQAAQYYQAKILDSLEKPTEAASIREKIVESEPFGWYAQLIQSHHKLQIQGATTDPRRGEWPHKAGAGPPQAPKPAPIESPSRVILATDTASESPSVFNWAAHKPSTRQPTRPKGSITPQKRAPVLPDSYTHNPLLDAKADNKKFESFVRESTSIWPELEIALHLSQVGLFELAAPYVESSYGDWKEAKKNTGPRAIELQQFVVAQSEWRAVIHATRDHHNGVRFASLLRAKARQTENGAQHLKTLTHPTAHMVQVQSASKATGVDPLLVLGLMRQESLFRRTARSNKGATGLMQVMPYTGSKIAFDLEERFIPDQLSEPGTNIRYGIWYLSKLLERFEGGWPLAVAAYNAGPMNVSSWYTRWEGEIELDDFVEQIPFTETRNYVKKVSMHYANYLDLYTENSFLALPKHPGHNRPGIVAY
jgi:tetratricopeptide (TPR) repeat protein